MLIGVPREIKVHEYRVGLTPESVRVLTARGHRVIVEHDAGAGIGAGDEDYRGAGAVIAAGADGVFGDAELVVKVKEPLPPERARLRPGQALFTYLHLAPDSAQTRDLVEGGVTGIAYETVTSPQGGLPLLAPMSVVAGRMAVQVAAHYLERPHGPRGVLMSGATGVPGARVLILGSGVVGSHAARVAVGMGAEVAVAGCDAASLQRLSVEQGKGLRAFVSSPDVIAAEAREADALIGAALVPGGLAPKLVTRAMLRYMKPGAVIVDVSIDQGGCCETSRPTTHAEPVYVADGILHYCVANMPGAVPRTSTYALNQATLPFIVQLADHGIVRALLDNVHLRNGLNVFRGAITNREVAGALGFPFTDALRAINAGTSRA